MASRFPQFVDGRLDEEITNPEKHLLSDVARGFFLSPTLHYWIPSSYSEGFFGDAENGWALAAFVFGAVDFLDEVDNEFLWDLVLFGDFRWGHVVFDVPFEDVVDDFVIGQGVEIDLPFAEFGGGGTIDRKLRDDFFSGVFIDPACEIKRFCFRHIANDTETATHIAVKRAVAERCF